MDVLECMEDPRRFWDCDWRIAFFLLVPTLIADSRDSLTAYQLQPGEG